RRAGGRRGLDPRDVPRRAAPARGARSGPSRRRRELPRGPDGRCARRLPRGGDRAGQHHRYGGRPAAGTARRRRRARGLRPARTGRAARRRGGVAAHRLSRSAGPSPAPGVGPVTPGRGGAGVSAVRRARAARIASMRPPASPADPGFDVVVLGAGLNSLNLTIAFHRQYGMRCTTVVRVPVAVHEHTVTSDQLVLGADATAEQTPDAPPALAGARPARRPGPPLARTHPPI